MAKRIFFARYQEEEKLGQGGIGEVYRVTDLWDNRVKALKLLLPEFKSSPLEQSFRQEFFLLKQFSHPNIVRVCDFHSADKIAGPAYSMEFIEGKSLADFLKEHPSQFNSILIQICQILEFIHLQGIIHCDLKPDNFKVISNSADNSETRVKLLDFGLAESVELLKESKIKGTLDYMAPEVLRGTPYDFRADLYSLGVILYELVTGQLPFHSPDPAVLISKVLEEPPPPPRTADRSVSPELEGLILRLLEKDSEKRISSASEVKEFFAGNAEADSVNLNEWIPLLESGSWVPAVAIQSAMSNQFRDAGVKGKLSLVCGAPGVGKSRALQELYYRCQKENRPVLMWELQKDFKDSCAEFCRRLSLLSEHSPDSAMKDLENLIAQIEPITDPDRLRRKMAEVTARLPFTLLIDQVNFQDEAEFIKCLSREHQNQNSTVIIAIKAFPGQVTLINQLIHSHPETETIELIQLSPQNQAELRLFLNSKLPGFRFSEKFFQRAWHFSGGNPGLALDFLKNLWQSGRLGYQNGKIKLFKSKEKVNAKSETLLKYLRFVLSSLSPAQHGFLQRISALGTKFDLESALYLSQTEIDDCYEHLRYFLREGILFPRQDSDKIEYEFSPPALQEQFYAEVAEQEKKSLHRQIADYLENQKSQGVEVSLAVLAHHHLQADVFEKAYHYSLSAAQEALKTLNKPEVLFHFKNALQMASAFPDIREKILKQGQVLRLRAHFWKTVGNFQKALSDYRQILKLFDKNSRQKILAEAYKDLGDLCRLKNNYRKGMVYLRRAEEIYRALDDKPELAHTLNNIGNLYWIALEYEKALEYLHRALELHRALGNQAGMASTLNNIAGVHLALSQYRTSIQHYQESLAIQRLLKTPEEVSRVLNNLGVVYMYTADYGRALDSLLESLSLNQQTSNLREQVFNLENLGECYQRMGKQTQAVQYSQQGLKLAGQIGFTLRKGRILVNLGKSYFELGEFSSALEQYSQAGEIAAHLEDWETQGWVYLYQAELYLKLSQPDLAQESLQKAQPLLKRLNEARLNIYYYLNRAELFRLRNDSASANIELSAALKLSLEKNLIEERLGALLNMTQINLNENDLEAAHRNLAELDRIFEQGEFSRFRLRYTLTRALYLLKTDGPIKVLELTESGLEKALSGQEWETALELAYLCGQLWHREKNYEQSYLAYEKGATLLKRLYQNIAQPEFKQGFLQGRIQRELLAEFKKMAGILAGSKA